MSKFALYRANLEFHAEWLRDEPCDATATGSRSYIVIAWCQLSPGNGEHEIRARGFYFRFPVTSFPFSGKEVFAFRRLLFQARPQLLAECE